ncbi:hypothetical protein SS50377_27799 [Spironucleus salmonicida]|uniref:Uncharacterized protein n=1 Tax=Spironucleus salmonicida TaxID=348837 RepID=V6LW81_9EUKA|nr:hypothetical protein SS50377_27799 [Spironucleus salmonicida]|eukprot:EST48887.1 Hypothetical protein SS50377_10995 [Spironucleus salmonicida]
MTDGARAADRSGDAAPESQGLMTTTLPAAAELPDPPVAHLSLDGRWDAAVRLDALTSLALADMDGTEPLRYVENVRDLRLERVSGKMDVGPALARLTIVDSPIMCRNPQGRDLPNLTEVVMSYYDRVQVSIAWQSLLDLLPQACSIRSITLHGKPDALIILTPNFGQIFCVELRIEYAKGVLCIPHLTESIHVVRSKLSGLRFERDSFPHLHTLYLVNAILPQACPSICEFLHMAGELRHLTLRGHRTRLMHISDMSRMKVLETLALTMVQSDIYLHPRMRSVTLTKCIVNNFQCDADSLPDLREIVLEGVTNESTSLARVMQLAHGLQRFIVRGTDSSYTAVSVLYLQPSVVVLELDRVRLDRLVLVSTPSVERLRLRNICIPPDQLSALARLVRVRTVTHLSVRCIGVGSGQQDAASLQQFALPAFIRRPGVDINLAVRVGQRYVQRGSMVYQEGDSQPVALPTRLAAFVYRQKIEPLVVLCGALVE